MRGAHPTRRLLWTAVAGVIPALLSATRPRVLAICGAQVPAYQEAIEGLRATIGMEAVRVVMLDQLGKGETICSIAGKEPPGVVIAVGSAAVDALSVCPALPPMLATMVLATPTLAHQRSRIDTTVTLEIPFDTSLLRIRRMYPGRNRIALVRGPALPPTAAAEAQASARRLGFHLDVLVCSSPRDLLETFQFLPRPYDFLWCLPDSTLYQGPAMSALVLAAMRRQIPLIGFSEGMVRAGALAGFYPDYMEVGMQTGELALRRLEGHSCPSRTTPRKIKTAVNERVARALGIRHSPGEEVLALQ